MIKKKSARSLSQDGLQLAKMLLRIVGRDLSRHGVKVGLKPDLPMRA